MHGEIVYGGYSSKAIAPIAEKSRIGTIENLIWIRRNGIEWTMKYSNSR